MKAMNKTILATAIALASSQSFAAGFLLNEHSASGLGRAFAGEGATNDNASVLARNPAAMALFDKTSISVVGTYVDPGVDMEGVSNPYQEDASNLDIDGAAPEAFIPAAYAIIPLNEKVAIGFASFTNFGLGTDFGSDHPAGQIAGKTDLITVNLNASISYRINDQWSIGGGANVVYGDAELQRYIGQNNGITVPHPIPGQPPIVDIPTIPTDTLAAEMSGDGFGFGYNLGVMYELNDNHRFALTYRSAVEVELEGEYTNDLPAPIGVGGASLDGHLDLNLPDIAEFSGYSKLSDKFTLHYGVMWTGWSEFEELAAVADEALGTIQPGDVLFAKQENFEDAWRYSLGASYQLNTEWVLRAGIAYDETPVPNDHRSISIPDSDRIWYTTGATYTLSENASLDFGLAYIDGEEVTVSEHDEFGQTWVMNSEGNAFLASAQFNYAF